jgi:hypothetical protein
MKAWGAVIAAVLVALAIPARAYDNEPTGFRGFAWGTPVETVQAKVTTWFNRAAAPYLLEYRSRSDLSINGVPLQSNFYQFYKGHFAAGIMAADGSQGAAMLDILKGRFGEPTKHSARRHEYYWVGSTTIVALICEGRPKTCRAAFESATLLDQRRKDLSASGKTGPDF